MSTKLPPHNLESEQIIIGSIFTDDKVFYDCAGIITNHDFHRPAHQIIFKVIEDTIKDQGCSVTSIAEHLEKADRLDMVGGQAYLNELLICTPTAHHVKHHANIIKEKSLLRKLGKLGNQLYLSAYDKSADTTKIINEAEQEFFNIALNGKGYDVLKDVISSTEMAKRAFGRIIEARGKPQEIRGLETGFEHFDKSTKGLRGFHILSASTGIGKTALALNWANHIGVINKIPSLFVNCEMSAEALETRLIGINSGVRLSNIESGNQDEYETKLVDKAVNSLHNGKLYITDNAPKNINVIVSLIYQHKIKHDIKVVFVDYLGEIDLDELAIKEKLEYLTYGRWAQTLKNICAKLGIALVLLAQLNREGESVPNRGNVQGSWKIVQKADVFSIIYIDKKTREMILKIDKQRHGFYPVKIQIDYFRKTQRMQEVGLIPME